jgi:hypothetical protein
MPSWRLLCPARAVAFYATNNLAGNERHIRVAIGRDYADVPADTGSLQRGRGSELSVVVVVARAEAPLPEETPPATVIRSKPRVFLHNLPFDQQQQQ